MSCVKRSGAVKRTGAQNQPYRPHHPWALAPQAFHVPTGKGKSSQPSHKSASLKARQKRHRAYKKAGLTFWDLPVNGRIMDMLEKFGAVPPEEMDDPRKAAWSFFRWLDKNAAQL
jgi:hypothetical protein